MRTDKELLAIDELFETDFKLWAEIYATLDIYEKLTLCDLHNNTKV